MNDDSSQAADTLFPDGVREHLQAAVRALNDATPWESDTRITTLLLGTATNFTLGKAEETGILIDALNRRNVDPDRAGAAVIALLDLARALSAWIQPPPGRPRDEDLP